MTTGTPPSEQRPGRRRPADKAGAPPRRRSTLRDVAALAGVSFKTVSRVVNDEPGVSEELAERVRGAAAQLNYRPNHPASMLRKNAGRSMSVGLVIDDVVNPFFAGIHRGLEAVLLTRGYTILAGSVLGSEDRARELVTAFTARQVDGLIVVPGGPGLAEAVAAERTTGTTIVYIDRVPGHLDADAVVSENRAGAFTGVDHLLRAGHRRVGFLGDSSSIETAVERHAGYVEAHAVAGVPLVEGLQARDVQSIEQAEAAAGELLDRPDPPTALFTAQNLLTVGAVRALRSRSVQHSVALVGFDDFLLADLLEPAVTVVAQDPQAIGHLAAERLLARLAGDEGRPGVYVVPTHLVTRGSGEIGATGPTGPT